MTCALGALMDNLHCHESGLECPRDGRCAQWDLEMGNPELSQGVRTEPGWVNHDLCNGDLAWLHEPAGGPYATLNKVLHDAFDQAESGKGKERHAADNAFEDQVICVVQRLLIGHPLAYQAGQAMKKTIEAGRLFNMEKPEAAKSEALGAINYLAAMCIMVDEMAHVAKKEG